MAHFGTVTPPGGGQPAQIGVLCGARMGFVTRNPAMLKCETCKALLDMNEAERIEHRYENARRFARRYSGDAGRREGRRA